MSGQRYWHQRLLHWLKGLSPYYRQATRLKEELALLTTYSSDTVYRLRYDDMTYDYISPAITKLLGFSPAEMRHINFRSLIIETKIIDDEFEPVRSFNPLEQKRKSGQTTRWQADYLMKTKDGRQIWINDISYPWYDAAGNIIGSIGSLRDVNQRVLAEKRTKEKIHLLTNTDIATGLANRHSFFKHLNQGLNHIRKNNEHVSILLIDVDNLKNINDRYGYKIGDLVLEEITSIICSCLRQEDLAARTGGGEFGIYLPNTPEEGAYWTGEHICLKISKHPFLTNTLSHPLRCTVSIGVASSEKDRYISAVELYRHADNRLYVAKHTGRNQVSLASVTAIH